MEQVPAVEQVLALAQVADLGDRAGAQEEAASPILHPLRTAKAAAAAPAHQVRLIRVLR